MMSIIKKFQNEGYNDDQHYQMDQETTNYEEEEEDNPFNFVF